MNLKIEALKCGHEPALIGLAGFLDISKNAVEIIRHRASSLEATTHLAFPELVVEVLRELRSREISVYRKKGRALSEVQLRAINDYLRDNRGCHLMLAYTHEDRPKLYTVSLVESWPRPVESHYCTVGIPEARALSEYLLRDYTQQGMDANDAAVFAIKTVQNVIDARIGGCERPIQVKILHCAKRGGWGLGYDSYVEEFPAAQVQEIAEIVSAVEGQAKRVQVKRIRRALQKRTERIFREMSKQRQLRYVPEFFSTQGQSKRKGRSLRPRRKNQTPDLGGGDKTDENQTA